MRWYHLIGIVVIVAVCLIIYIQQYKSNNQSALRTNPYDELRSQVFETSPETIGIEAKAGQPYAVLMEIGFSEGVATLVSYIDGNASLYLSSGGGVIGGFAHENVRKTAINFVSNSKEYISKMEIANSYPLPQPGYVRFYVLTKEGVYSIEDKEQGIQEGNDFTPLYTCGQNVITELRKISEKT